MRRNRASSSRITFVSWTRVLLAATVAVVIVFAVGKTQYSNGIVADSLMVPLCSNQDTQRLQIIRRAQEAFYKQKIKARDDHLRLLPDEKAEKDVGTGRIWFAYEPFWQCPFGEQLNGLHGDGVKWTCGLPLMALRPVSREGPDHLAPDGRVRPPCIVYSGGSNKNSMFEDDVKAHTNCEIHIFDPAESGPPGYANNDWTAKYSYHSTKMGGTADNETMTFSQLFDKFGHDFVDIFKIDIEGGEWHLFEELRPEELKRIGQIQIELHSPTYPKLDKFFSKLEQNGFRIFHKEVNVQWIKGCEYALINTAWDPEFAFEVQDPVAAAPSRALGDIEQLTL